MWHLVHNNIEVLALFEINEGANTATIFTLFAGSKEQCDAEINRLELKQQITGLE